MINPRDSPSQRRISFEETPRNRNQSDYSRPFSGSSNPRSEWRSAPSPGRTSPNRPYRPATPSSSREMDRRPERRQSPTSYQSRRQQTGPDYSGREPRYSSRPQRPDSSQMPSSNRRYSTGRNLQRSSTPSRTFTSSREPTRPSWTPECYYCHRKGHYKRNCRKLQADLRQWEASRPGGSSSRASFCNISDPTQPQVTHATVKIYDRDIKAILDSGASRSIISQKLLSKLVPNPRHQLKPTNVRLSIANRSTVYPTGELALPIQIGPKVAWTRLLVVEILATDLILGTDFLLKTKNHLDYDHLQLSCSSQRPGDPR